MPRFVGLKENKTKKKLRQKEQDWVHNVDLLDGQAGMFKK